MNKNELEKYKQGYREGWRAGVRRVEDVINLWVDEEPVDEYLENLDQYFEEQNNDN